MDYRKGIPVASPIALLVAANQGVLVHDLPATRTGKIRKAHIRNLNPLATFVSFGAGLAGAYVAATIAYQVLAGMEMTLLATELPDVEFTADITAAATVTAAAPNNVEVQIQTEEYIGTAG